MDKLRRKICPVCGRIHTACSKECPKHYRQFLKFGKYLDSNPRTIYDPNEIRVLQDYCEIDTYDKNGIKNFTYLFDTENLPLIHKYKWYTQIKDGNPYLMCSLERNRKEHYHRMCVCLPKGTVDHINGNTLDNRKSNLRVADMTVQNLNKRTTRGIQIGKYTYKGANLVKGYAATFGFKGKRLLSKYYKTIEEALYHRYLFTTLLDFPVVCDMSWEGKLTEEQKNSILKDFRNKFKDWV